MLDGISRLLGLAKFLCKHTEKTERITNLPLENKKTVESVCVRCRKVVKKETYVRKQWGFELIKEDYY